MNVIEIKVISVTEIKFIWDFEVENILVTEIKAI